MCQRCSDRGLICEYKDDHERDNRSIRGISRHHMQGGIRGSMSMHNLRTRTSSYDGHEYSFHGQPIKVQIFDQYSPYPPLFAHHSPQRFVRAARPNPLSITPNGFFSQPVSAVTTPNCEFFPHELLPSHSQIVPGQPLCQHSPASEGYNRRMSVSSQSGPESPMVETPYSAPLASPTPLHGWNHPLLYRSEQYEYQDTFSQPIIYNTHFDYPGEAAESLYQSHLGKRADTKFAPLSPEDEFSFDRRYHGPAVHVVSPSMDSSASSSSASSIQSYNSHSGWSE
jgi:hypothetical protein